MTLFGNLRCNLYMSNGIASIKWEIHTRNALLSKWSITSPHTINQSLLQIQMYIASIHNILPLVRSPNGGKLEAWICRYTLRFDTKCKIALRLIETLGTALSLYNWECHIGLLLNKLNFLGIVFNKTYKEYPCHRHRDSDESVDDLATNHAL